MRQDTERLLKVCLRDTLLKLQAEQAKIKTVERHLCIFNCFLFLAYWATAHHEIARRAMNGSAAYSPINYASFYVTTTAVREIARRAMNGSAAYSPITVLLFMIRRLPSVK